VGGGYASQWLLKPLRKTLDSVAVRSQLAISMMMMAILEGILSAFYYNRTHFSEHALSTELPTLDVLYVLLVVNAYIHTIVCDIYE
jgi:hypothetical protein